MISIKKLDKTLFNNEPYVYADLCGLSTDDKPIDLEYTLDDGGKYSNLVANGSIFTEIDTGNVYMFDLESEEWFKISGEGGGGGDDMKKFDYLIPTIDLDMMSSGDEIVDTAVLDVLNEIQTFMSSRLEPVIVGLYYIDEDGNDGFAICNAIQYLDILERLYFVTKDYTIYLSYESDKWHLYKVV